MVRISIRWALEVCGWLVILAGIAVAWRGAWDDGLRMVCASGVGLLLGARYLARSSARFGPTAAARH